MKIAVRENLKSSGISKELYVAIAGAKNIIGKRISGN